MSNVGAVSYAYPTGFPTNTHPLLLLGCYPLRQIIGSSTVEKVMTTYVCEAP
jgi:hypothetical protein